MDYGDTKDYPIERRPPETTSATQNSPATTASGLGAKVRGPGSGVRGPATHEGGGGPGGRHCQLARATRGRFVLQGITPYRTYGVVTFTLDRLGRGISIHLAGTTPPTILSSFASASIGCMQAASCASVSCGVSERASVGIRQSKLRRPKMTTNGKSSLHPALLSHRPSLQPQLHV